MGGFTRTLSHQYDAAGNRIRLTHPDGNFFTFDRDALGRLVWARENGAGFQAYLTYHPSGARKMRHLWSLASLYDYDSVQRLTALNVLFGPQVNNILYGFGYNPASQVVQETRGNDAYAWTGAYNVARGYSVNGLNQYVTVGPNSYAYDANGNLTSDGSSTFAYDVENRLVSASGAKTAALVYDPLGRLFQTSGGAAGTTRFLYDGDALVAEYSNSGALLRRYLHGPGPDEPLIWYEGADLASRRRLQVDRQGSIVAVADQVGHILAINAYDPWGIPGVANQGRFQYTGQAWIGELGMYHYKARVYSPTLGRFLQTDPVGYEDQINLYAYVGNDPINATDPTGREVFYVGGGCDGYCTNNTTIVKTYAEGRGSFFTHFDMDGLQRGMIAAEKRGEPVIVIGHSWGASAVRNLVADSKTPRPDLLVTVDPVGDMHAPRGKGNDVGGLWVNITAKRDDSSESFGNRVSNLWGRSDTQDTGRADIQVDSNRVHEDFGGMLRDAGVQPMIKSIEKYYKEKK